MPKKAKRTKDKQKLSLLQKLSLFFFNRPRTTALIWLIMAVFGFASYQTLLQREGFPSVETPFAISNGTYLVNDPSKIDKEVSKPLSETILEEDGVKSVQTTSQAKFYNIIISYEENIHPETKCKEISGKVANEKILPPDATFSIEPIKFGFNDRGDDLIISIHSENGSTKDLVEKAKYLETFIKSKNIPEVDTLTVISPFESAFNPTTGQTETAQKSFDRYGAREGGENKFYNSVIIGLKAKGGTDNLELNDAVMQAISEAEKTSEFENYQASISASYAPEIRAQIDELQKVLLEALAAILVVGSIVIAIRASVLTVISLITVLAIVNGLLYLIDYTLNTITLFSLILGLALMIDDTIIMVEALDAQRRRQKNAAKAVAVATGKVSRAMMAATLTAILSFVPLIFVSGILGEFIRAIPVTIIAALFISLLVALVIIPLFARFLLLSKQQMKSANVGNFTAGIEHYIAELVAKPMLLARHSKAKLASVSAFAIIFSFIFIGAGAFLFQKVTFNIFPSSKDTNKLTVNVNFAPDTDIESAQKIVDEVDEVVAREIGENFNQASYYGESNQRAATLTINITDYKNREITSQELVAQLDSALSDFNKANVSVAQLDVGPPPAEFAVQISSSEKRTQALALSREVAKFLENTELKRTDGSIAKVKNASGGEENVYTRNDNVEYVATTATFEDTDTTTLVSLAQNAVEKEFDRERLSEFGLSPEDLNFSFGQEDENQDSFNTLAYSFPIVMIAIYILLVFQFRSFIQPILIFMAIPFSLFGITLGLYLTDNPFSFFAMLGFFALIGLSLKNTILLVDFANQSRRAGKNPVDAIHEALAERFRPLVATSLTAIVSLIPLYLTSPFWESLTVVLIFGLLSSTFLVITVFPYYFLAGEYARLQTKRLYNKIRK
ncbi:MAG TPA: efflux RND transporter permease subunit [Candidatus Saccharimonadales bacterium]|nr:efflux RND transporter permease subunit [Candidatus Saccharimonadales bacterium]